jgi:predicted nucleic acid-binding Zn ribbon protein
MDKVGDAVARELGRFGPAAGMAPLVEVWPRAVGGEIARNAWPARLARDGTLHVHTKDSIWAFELTARAEQIRARLEAVAPPKLVFTPGPLPALEAVEEEVEKRVAKPAPGDIEKAESLTRGIRDEDLRKVVAKTVAAGLAAAGNDRSFC